MPYSIREPAPHHPQSMAYGRGGAGNRTRPLPPSSLNKTSLTSAQPSEIHASIKSNQGAPNFSTGRGGAGNMHSSNEDRCMFSFDEELAKQGKDHAPVYHVGRGGQGNAVVERRESDASASSRGSDKRTSLEWIRGLARTSRS